MLKVTPLWRKIMLIGKLLSAGPFFCPKGTLLGIALLLMYFIGFWSINHCSIKSLVRFLNCRATEGRGKEIFNFH